LHAHTQVSDVIAANPLHRVQEVDPRPYLSSASLDLLARAEANLSELCSAAARLEIPLLLDAEQSHRQHAIDYLAKKMMKKHNLLPTDADLYHQSPPRPIVFNTYQMYLDGAADRVRRDLAAAGEQSYCFAAKIVRGAYHVSETERAEREQRASPLLPNKQATDSAYDSAVECVLDCVAANEAAASVMVATHNATSVGRAVAAMEKLGIAPGCPSVQFAQVKGE